MSVEFEWRFNRETGQEPVEPTPKPRRLRWHFWLLIAALILLALGLAFYAWWRVRRTALARLEQGAQAVAELEMFALATGDTELYTSLQDPADPDWLAAREAQLLSGIPLAPPAPGLVATLPITIENPRVIGDRARVEFVRLAGWPEGEQALFRGIAFYRLTSDGRWVHTAPDPDYGGRILVWVGPRNDLAGHIVHTALMEQLAPELELTAEAFCGLLSCPASVRFTLALTSSLDASASDPAVLPAPHLVGVPEGEQARDVWIQAMRGVLVDRMLDQVVGQPTGGLIGHSLRRWVAEGLAAKPPHQPDPMLLSEALSAGRLAGLESLWEGPMADERGASAEEEAALFVAYVEHEYGQEGVVRLLDGLAQATTLDALLRTALGVDLASFEEGWLEYLEEEITRQASVSHIGLRAKRTVAFRGSTFPLDLPEVPQAPRAS